MVCPSGKVKLFFIGFKFVLHNFAIVETMQTLCIMKRILTTLMAILLMCLTGLSFADEVTKIIIIEKPIVSEGNKNVNRAPAKPQIEGYYSSITCSLELVFTSNIGMVTVSLENQTTGEIQDYVVSSALGQMIMPIESNSTYRMDIVTDTGRTFYAIFFVGGEDENPDVLNLRCK